MVPITVVAVWVFFLTHSRHNHLWRESCFPKKEHQHFSLRRLIDGLWWGTRFVEFQQKNKVGTRSRRWVKKKRYQKQFMNPMCTKNIETTSMVLTWFCFWTIATSRRLAQSEAELVTIMSTRDSSRLPSGLVAPSLCEAEKTGSDAQNQSHYVKKVQLTVKSKAADFLLGISGRCCWCSGHFVRSLWNNGTELIARSYNTVLQIV